MCFFCLCVIVVVVVGVRSVLTTKKNRVPHTCDLYVFTIHNWMCSVFDERVCVSDRMSWKRRRVIESTSVRACYGKRQTRMRRGRQRNSKKKKKNHERIHRGDGNEYKYEWGFIFRIDINCENITMCDAWFCSLFNSNNNKSREKKWEKHE